jgi:hypothetical protein
MKNYTTLEIKTAKKYAYNFVFCRYRLINRIGRKKFDFDGRTRIGNLSNKIYQEINKISDIEKAKEKAIIRRSNVYNFVSIINLPIVKDFVNNKPTQILKDRLRFGHRNHWAKTVKDFQILEILSNK